MTDTDLNLTLGRALIAAAWADGQLDEQERAALEDLLFRLPGLTPSQWRILEDELEHPIDEAGLKRRQQELLEIAEDPRSRGIAQQALEGLSERLPAGSAEVAALGEIARGLDEPESTRGAGLFGRLRRVLADPLREHADRLRDQLTQTERIERSLEQRVADHWPAGEAVPDADQLHRLCVGASILAHVIHLDDEVDSGEVEAMNAALREHWGLQAGAAGLVTEVALADSADGVDLYSLLRDFFEHTDEDERQRFLAAVFQVAAGDGRATYDEIEEVRRIGRGLLLSHRHFIAAKLTLDDDQRET